MINFIRDSLHLFRLSYRNNKIVAKYAMLVVALEVASVGLLFGLNQIYGRLYDGIQTYKVDQIWSSIWAFSGVAGILTLVGWGLTKFCNRLAREIREGLTEVSLDLDSEDPMFSQRVQEDLRKFGEASVEFWSGLLKAGMKLPVFVGVIGQLTHWYIGVIVVAAVIGGTYVTRLAGRRLVQLQADQESYEASFRESIAEMQRGAYDYPKNWHPRRMFHRTREQFLLINAQVGKLALVQSGLGQGFALMPFILLMPMYVSKALLMGEFMQSVNALGKIIDSLSILIDSRQVLVNIGTSLTRLEFLRGRR